MTTLQDRLDEKYRLGIETGEKRGQKRGEKKGIRKNQRTIVLSMLKQGVEEAEIRKLLITVPSSVITEVIGGWNSRKEYIHLFHREASPLYGAVLQLSLVFNIVFDCFLRSVSN